MVNIVITAVKAIILLNICYFDL